MIKSFSMFASCINADELTEHSILSFATSGIREICKAGFMIPSVTSVYNDY